jgi:hypothetical protein
MCYVSKWVSTKNSWHMCGCGNFTKPSDSPRYKVNVNTKLESSLSYTQQQLANYHETLWSILTKYFTYS